MMIPLLTKRALALLLALLLLPFLGLLAAAEFESIAILLLVLLLVLSLFLSLDLSQALRARRALTVEIEGCSPMRAAIPAKLQIKVSDGASKQFSQVLIRPLVPTGIEACPPILSFGSSPLQVDFDVLPVKRGEFCFEEFDVRLQTRIRIVSWQFRARFNAPLKLLVYPDFLAAEEQEQKSFFRLNYGQRVFNLAAGEGREFSSLRQYAIGDDTRRIDWKRSARHESLVVKEYRPESHQRVNIAVDCGRRMASRVAKRLQIDHALDAAASLANIALANDDEVGLFAFNHQVVLQTPSKRGAAHSKLLTELLSKVDISEREADYGLLTSWAAGQNRRSLLVLITSIANPASLEHIRTALLPMRHKHLPLVMALADSELNSLALSAASNLEDAYVISAANQQIQAIKDRAAWLERSGIICRYCETGELAGMLANVYFRLKLSGRL